MNINDIVLNEKEYSLYSWITTPEENVEFEYGKKKFLDDCTIVNEIRNTESGYNTKVTFHDGFVKWIYLREDCTGESIINGISHKYKITERE